jgi:hypothetical protein
MLDASPEIDLIRRLVGKRLMDPGYLEKAQRDLEQMLLVLHRAGFVRLEPEPPKPEEKAEDGSGKVENRPLAASQSTALDITFETGKPSSPGATGILPVILGGTGETPVAPRASGPPPYKPILAHPTAELSKLALFRSVNPLYGIFLVNQLGVADRRERLQAFESVLDFPAPVARFVRVPKQEEMPPGPLATERLDAQLLQFGLATMDELVKRQEEDEEPWRPRRSYDAEQDEEPRWVLTVAEKLRRLFDYECPGVYDLRTRPVWAAGGMLMDFNGNFNKFVGSRDVLKQEGIVFRHVLRLILLLDEFRPLCPPDQDLSAWQYDLDDIIAKLTESCHEVDPASTDKALEKTPEEQEEAEEFGAGIFD